MKQEVKIGQTDYTVLVLIRDTAGAPKTGLTNGSAGIDVCYTRVETDNDVVLTAGAPVALATPALTDPHLDWGFLQVDATNAPGLYRLDLPDGVFASGAWSAVVSLIATGIDPCQIEFVLVAFDPRDSVRLGLTALPNAAADAAGGLPISDAGGLDVDAIKTMTDKIGTVVNTGGTATIGAILGDFANSALVTRIATIDGIVDDILVDTAVIGALGAGLTGIPWNSAWDAEVESEVSDALAAVNLDHLVGTATGIPAIPAGTFIDQIMDDGTAVYDRTTDSLQAIRDTAPLGTAMRGTDSAALASVCTEARLAELDAANLITDVANVKTDTAAILVDTGTTLDVKIDAIDTVVDLIEDIIRNKMAITDINGNTILYQDDNATPLYSVNGLITDDATTTVRLRLA